MSSTIQSQQLAQLFEEEQRNLVNFQNEILCEESTVGVGQSGFYSKTLTNLSICNELVLTNIQLKELNHYKIKMLRIRITEIAARIENFKSLLKAFYQKFDPNKF